MLRSARLFPSAVVFLVWFALWVVAGRYISVDFYRLTFGQAVQTGLGLTTLLVALVLVILPSMRPHGQRMRWSYALLCIGLLVAVEVVWPFVMNAPWDFAKTLGIILHLSTPALLAFGIAAAIGEWRAHRLFAAATTAGDATSA